MLGELLKYASMSSKDFPIVRVDLYCEFSRVIFGELTFLPKSGIFWFDPPEYDELFGDFLPDAAHRGRGIERRAK